MKKISIGILIGLMLLSGCKRMGTVYFDVEISETGLKGKILNDSKETVFYGEPYTLEKKNGNNWEPLEPAHEMVFNLILYTLDPYSNVEIEIDWEYHYGRLDNGTYRFMKELSNSNDDKIQFESIEFIIEKRLDMQASLSETFIELTITNNDLKPYTFEIPYELEKYEEGKWVVVSPVKEVMHDISLIIYPSETVKIPIDLDNYKKLSPGKYRVYKDAYSKDGEKIELYAPFRID